MPGPRYRDRSTRRSHRWPYPRPATWLRIYVREVEQLGASPSSGELAERVVSADYVLQFLILKSETTMDIPDELVEAVQEAQ